MLRIERHDAVAVWTVDRPAARNALDHATLAALRDAVANARTDTSLRAVILTGQGDIFVSGGDLRELETRGSAEDAAQFGDLGHDVTEGLAALPFPVLCALPGAAIGGGAELALACDLRIADARAFVSFKQVRMGVTTAWGTAARLVTLVGPSAALRLLTTAENLAARAAKDLGLVDLVTNDGEALARALAWAGEIAKGSRVAVEGMKRLVRAASTPSPDVRALERALFIETWSGPDHAAAVASFFAARGTKNAPTT